MEDRLFNFSDIPPTSDNWPSINGAEILLTKRVRNVTRRILKRVFAEPDEDYILDSPKVKAALIAVYSLVFFFCVFGNLTVILVIKLHWRMQSVTKFCLSNLAFANLCVGIFCVYQNLSLYLIDSWVFGEFLCKMYHFVNILSHTASILILVVITIERYMVILHPFICRRFLTVPKLRILIIFVWILSGIIASPRFYYIELIPNPTFWKKTDANGTEVLCTLGKSIYTSKPVDMIEFISFFCLPLLIMSVLYTKIILHLRRRNRLASIFAITSSPTHIAGRDEGTQENSPGPFTRRLEFSKRNRSLRKTFFSEPNLNERSLRRNVSTSSTVITIDENSCTGQNEVDEVFLEGEINMCQTIRSGNKRQGKRTSKRMRKRRPQFQSQSTMIRINFSRRKIGGNELGTENRRKGKSGKTKVLGILAVIVGSFAICNFPFYLRKLYKNFIHRPEYEGNLTELSTPISFILMYANCAINPFLYAFMSKNFRSSFLDLIRCNWKKPSQ